MCAEGSGDVPSGRPRLSLRRAAPWSICVAATLMVARPSAVLAEISCTPVEGGCLSWHVHSPAFTPNSRYLYFSYSYLPTELQYSATAIGRVALDDGKVEAIARTCHASYRAPAFSPDGKLLAFVWAPKGGYPQIAYVSNTEQANLDRASYVTDLRSRSKDSPQFSPDGRFIYFTNNIAASAQTISRFDLASGKIDDVLGPSKLEDTFGGVSREFFTVVRNVRIAEIDGRTQLLFLAWGPRDLSLIEPMVTPPRTASDIKIQDFLYRYDPVSRSLALHPLNLRPELRERGRGIHGFVIEPGGALIYTRGNFVINRKGDLLRTRLDASGAEPELFAPLGETTFAFAVSGDGRWIAQTWQKWFETRDGRSRGAPIVLRVVDRGTGAVRDLDFGAREIAETLLLRCPREPWPSRQ
jgi:dipeptidyl aminopeptidase/acylaminoacyl peptidase